MTSVHLGFEVGTGGRVEIPLQHLAICGQTQLAGKTTALEAFITRSGVRAVAFVTKRGESSFADARRIDPYFREQADWKFVASILEASRGEKLKFERAWIIRASRGARTLADVQRNVRKAMETAKGLSADVYLTLEAYLDDVVPQIARIRWAPAVSLRDGINAMDVTDLSVELQHLVITSTLEWTLRHAEHSVVVIPEAWRFIPQGRGTPVKLAAEAYVRQGAALGNFLALDSQDLGGIDKTILRSVSVWLLGVQREINEITRTLANIPASVAKPKAADLATLGLGEFFACWGKHVVRVYVQPAWMPAGYAKQVATGALTVELAATCRPVHPGGPIAAPRKEDTVTKGEADQLTRENEQLRTENADLHRRLEALEKGQHDVSKSDRPADRERDSGRRPPDRDRAGARAAHAAPVGDGGRGARDGSPRSTTAAPSNRDVDEALYQAIKARLIADAPAILKVLVDRPELEITVERRTIEADGNSLRGRIARLLKDGWFDQVKAGNATFEELKRRGFSTAKPNVYKECDKLAEFGFLTKESAGYQAVASMKVRVVEREVA